MSGSATDGERATLQIHRELTVEPPSIPSLHAVPAAIAAHAAHD